MSESSPAPVTHDSGNEDAPGPREPVHRWMSPALEWAARRHFVGTSQVRRGDRALDLSGDRGDVARWLHERVGTTGRVVIGAPDGARLHGARDRLTDRGIVTGIAFVACSAAMLPFPDASFDLVTIAFDRHRDVSDPDATLREMRRVLKVGGQARLLELAGPRAPRFQPLPDLRALAVSGLGRLFAHPATDRHLADPVRRHPAQDALQAKMEAAGFARCSYRSLSTAGAAIHTGHAV